MFNYYLGLALRSLRRNIVLTVLMIAAIGVGIGASMTTLTIFRAMSGNPIPRKSDQLYVPQIDSWGPDNPSQQTSDRLQTQVSYIDAMAWMKAGDAKRRTALYAAALPLRPANPQMKPFKVLARAAYADFFPMFEVPFEYGGPWSASDDENRAAVVVITRELNARLFGGGNSVGKYVVLENESYRVVGVLDAWRPVPRYYDLSLTRFGASDDVFLPFTRAIDKHMQQTGSFGCATDAPLGWEESLRSECVWIGFWVELPTSADVGKYRQFLRNYAAEQGRMGRFHWPAATQLRDVSEWLTYRHVVPGEVRILVLVSFGFLFVCLMNAMGLMLAKIAGRSGDFSVRRALGASRGAIFAQCLVETAVIGLGGAGLGLLLTLLGLGATRALLSKSMTTLTYIDWTDTGVAVLLAVAATVMAGLYPTWRAAHIEPAWQLKEQ
ncbi:MAG: ABC transporter permease [Steroidobacteraceae bacterium]